MNTIVKFLIALLLTLGFISCSFDMSYSDNSEEFVTQSCDIFKAMLDDDEKDRCCDENDIFCHL